MIVKFNPDEMFVLSTLHERVKEDGGRILAYTVLDVAEMMVKLGSANRYTKRLIRNCLRRLIREGLVGRLNSSRLYITLAGIELVKSGENRREGVRDYGIMTQYMSVPPEYAGETLRRETSHRGKVIIPSHPLVMPSPTQKEKVLSMLDAVEDKAVRPEEKVEPRAKAKLTRPFTRRSSSSRLVEKLREARDQRASYDNLTSAVKTKTQERNSQIRDRKPLKRRAK